MIDEIGKFFQWILRHFQKKSFKKFPPRDCQSQFDCIRQILWVCVNDRHTERENCVYCSSSQYHKNVPLFLSYLEISNYYDSCRKTWIVIGIHKLDAWTPIHWQYTQFDIIAKHFQINVSWSNTQEIPSSLATIVMMKE